MRFGVWMFAALLAGPVAGCGEPQGGNAVAPAPPAQTPQAASAKAINDAGAPVIAPVASPAPAPAAGAPPQPVQPDPAVIKAEVLLDRAHAAPGVIDGIAGSNLSRAVSAYEQMNGLPDDGQMSPAVWARLAGGTQAPAAAVYTLTAQDVAGPFYPDVGDDMVAASKLTSVGYSRASEAVAARFHMSEKLLVALNPGVDFKTAGAAVVVAQPMVTALAPVDHIQVDKAAARIRAYDQSGALIASLPATVGSTERPSPSGDHKVVGVSFNPTYTYDPSKLTWGPRSHGKFSIRPGPNNPVGLVWIALNAPGYGLHGSPSPDKIGKTQSHGCVRMTNWDAVMLGAAVKPGVEVDFVNQRPT